MQDRPSSRAKAMAYANLAFLKMQSDESEGLHSMERKSDCPGERAQ